MKGSVEEGLNKEEKAIYDRQLRLWGKDAQTKLKASQMLLMNMQGGNSELARHLVLAGVTTHIYDENIVTEDELTTNYLLTPSNIGSHRSKSVIGALKKMNPLCNISECEFSSPSPLFPKQIPSLCKYSGCVLETKSVEEAEEFSNMCKNKTPHMIIIESGYNAYIYVDLYQREPVEEGESPDISFGSVMKRVLGEDIPDLGILGARARRKYYNPMLYALLAKCLLLRDVDHDHDHDDGTHIVSLLRKHLGVNRGKLFEDEGFAQLVRKYYGMWGVEYNPVSAIVGSIASQMLIQMAQRQVGSTQKGIFFYDSQNQTGNIYPIEEL